MSGRDSNLAPSTLIVDDSRVMRKMISRTLAMCGFPSGCIREAHDAESAMAVLADGGVELLLIDLNLPGTSGRELIDRLGRMPAACGVRIVAVSTESCESRIAALAKRGVFFVHKPFAPEKLREKVADALGAKSHA